MESPVQAGTIWAGSDDGLVHLSRDGGKNWSNVTPPSSIMPEWIQINSLEASPHDPATAYLAGTMYKWDDNRPYLYKTSDWQDLEEDHERHSRHRFHARHSRRSEQTRTALRGNRNRNVRVV